MALVVAALAGPSLAPAAADTPTPAPSCGSGMGTAQPILLVHGWNASASTWGMGTPSMASALRAIPGVWVDDTFDYQQANDQWVTDGRIGPAVGARIHCLAQASHAAGGPGRVIVAGHSMGGLALRCALDSNCSGASAASADEVALAITLGTPNLGSFLRVDSQVSQAEQLVLWSTQLTCHANQLNNPDLSSLCRITDVLAGPASQAFTPGSAQLAALGQIPSTIPTVALAGQVQVKTRLFEVPVTLPGDAGDLVVGTDSALADQNAVGGSGGGHMVDCGALDLSVTGLIVDALSSSELTCWHGGEPAAQAFQNWVSQSITDYLRAAPNQGTTGPSVPPLPNPVNSQIPPGAVLLPSTTWRTVGGASLSASADGTLTVHYDPVYWGGITATTQGSCSYEFGGHARLAGGRGYSLGVRASIDATGTPHAQTIQYDAGMDGYRDAALPGSSESGPVVRATLDSNWHEIRVAVTAGTYRESVDGRVIFSGKTTLPCGGGLFIRLWGGTTAQFRDLYEVG
jgi:hypothetical protein